MNRSRWFVLALLVGMLVPLASCGGHGGATFNITPSISYVFPAIITAGSQGFTLFIAGTNFQSGTGTASFAFWNGAALSTVYNSTTTQLEATVPASYVLSPNVVQITVMNPAPGGGVSNAATFTIEPFQNTGPLISSISPSQAAAGAASFTLTVNGSNFTATDTVTWNGEFRTSTFVPCMMGAVPPCQKITAQITSSDVASVGTAAVSVLDTGTGIIAAPSVVFTITGGNNPAPGALAFSPTSAIAGGPDFELVIGGSNFVPASTATFNGAPLAVAFIGSNQLDAWVSAADIASAGVATVTITNPAPGGGTSHAMYPVNNLQPTIVGLSPASITAGSQSFFLVISGTNFISGPNGATFAFWNGSPRNTTYNSLTQQLSVTILTSDVATAGTAQVTVENPGPGGGASAALPFTIAAPQSGGPVISPPLVPASTFAGGPSFNLTATGTNFSASDALTWNGMALISTFTPCPMNGVPPCQTLTAQVNAANIVLPGFASVAVMPTSGASSPSLDFTITGPANLAPTLAAVSPVSPTSANAGGPAFELTINGSDFVPTSSVMWNATSLAVSFINSGQLVAWVPASLIAASGNVNVTVVNPPPPPGGSTSQIFVFTIH